MTNQPDPAELTDRGSIDIDAPADQVWELVSDVTRTGEWSPVCRRCAWTDPDHTGVGATFTGYNEHDGREWETTSTVVAATPGESFVWEVGSGFVRWGYELRPLGEGRSELTETWAFLQPGLDFFREKFGDEAPREIESRRDLAHNGIPETLAAIKKIAETT